MDSTHLRAILTGVVFALGRESRNNGRTLMTTSHSLLRVLSHKANVVPARSRANEIFRDALSNC